jgi:hypothetical protein
MTNRILFIAIIGMLVIAYKVDNQAAFDKCLVNHSAEVCHNTIYR